MKKIFTLFAASALVLSVSAKEHQLNNNRSFQSASATKVTKVDDTMKMSKSEIKADLGGRTIVKARKADDNHSIEGSWIFSMYDGYLTSSSKTVAEIEYVATLDGNELWFDDPTDYEFPMYATYDATSGEVTFPIEYFGQMSDGTYVYQQPMGVDAQGYIVDVNEMYALYNSDDDTLTFDGYCFIADTACKTQDPTDLLGYYTLYEIMGVERYVYVDDSDEWNDVGMATFMDGWVLPLFGIDQSLEENQYEVLLQQNKENENIYRLFEPYQSGPAADYNMTTRVGTIAFDLTDPDHVTFLGTEAGFSYPGAGVTKLYPYNQLSWNVEYWEEEADVIIDLLGDEIPYTTFKDGVVTLTSNIVNGKRDNDALFGIQNNIWGGYGWQSNDGVSANMAAKIIFPAEGGVGSIGSDNNDGKVRFYNLQGLEISNPEQGQIYIKLENNKATKVIK